MDSIPMLEGSGAGVPPMVDTNQSRRFFRAFDLTNEIAVAVTGAPDIHALLETTADHARRLLRCEAATVLLVDESTHELRFDAADGGPQGLSSVRLRIDQGICGWVATHDQPALCDDPSKDDRFCRDVDARTGFTTRSLVAVPLRASGRVIGVLEGVNATGRSGFDQDDVTLLTSFGPFVAVAIQNIRATAELRASQEVALAAAERLELAVVERTQQLQGAKRELESTFDAIAEPISIIDGFNVRRANIEFARRSGVAITKVSGRTCYEVLAGRSSPCEGCPIASVTSARGDVVIDDRTYRVSQFPVPGSTQAVLHYRDVTQERALSRKLQETERLAAVGQLAAGAAHEINNPMGSITSNLETLKEILTAAARAIEGNARAASFADSGRTDAAAKVVTKLRDDIKEHHLDECVAEGREMVDESLAGASRISEIVRGLKQLARQEVGGVDSVDVGTCLDRAASRAVHAAKGSVVWGKKDAAQIQAHPVLIEHAFSEIVRNAMQATPTSPVEIAVEKADREVLITVTDRGEGMSDEVRRRAFDPFFTTRGVGRGVGLGLTAAWGIVRRHGGQIDLESAPNSGTKVRIRLPLAGSQAT